MVQTAGLVRHRSFPKAPMHPGNAGLLRSFCEMLTQLIGALAARNMKEAPAPKLG